MARLKTVDECTYRAVANTKGKFVGRVDEFEDLRTKPCGTRAQAIDEIITLTAEKLRHLHAATDISKGAPR